jgi:hypothetical protein
MSFGFGFALPAYPLRGGGGNNPFNQSGPTLDLSFAGVVTDQSDPNGYTLNTNFIIPQYQIAAQYVVWETGVGLVDKTFSQIITFTRASTGTYFNSSGVLTSAAIDAPRFDYNPSTLAAQGLLIEEARTNLLLQSAAFNTTWVANNVTITADTTASPDGGTNGDGMLATVAGGYVSQTSQSFTAGSTITLSVFAKKNASNFLRVELGNLVSCWFNLNTGATASNNAGSGNVLFSAKSIQAISNGWYRCVLTVTTSTITTLLTSIYATDSDGNSSSINSSVFLWGAQLEAGAFPTSYIPTTTTALTRSADVAAVNTLSPWFNSAASTLYTEFNTLVPTTVSASAVVAGYDDGTANNRFSNFYTSNTGAVAANQVIAGTPSFTITAASGLTLSNVQKQATRFQAGSYASSANGAAVVTDSFASAPPTVNTLRFGLRPSGTQANMWLRRVTVYPRGLANAELVALST